ncbi:MULTISPECIES: hypothetical protein [Listeria]|uniref:hypothetical protein n=1 Tax=Listeria TaxID=1637 RepID=UPI000B5884DE|nr:MULTISPECIES: hypothetical protein [Listeria]
METKLKDSELLEKSHFPLQLFFNMVTEGTGFGENYGAFTFPGDLDDFDIANGEGFEEVELPYKGYTKIEDFFNY